MRLPLIPLLLWMSAAALCRAQEVVLPDSTVYRWSVGINVGLSHDLDDGGLLPADPIPLPSGGTKPTASMILSTWRFDNELGIELALNLMNAGKRYGPVSPPYPEISPEYATLDYVMPEQRLTIFTAGLSYRFRLGQRLSIEPTALAGYTDVDSTRSTITLKRIGSNEYMTIGHGTGEGSALVLMPALTIRYAVRDLPSRWGLQLRAAYTSAVFELDHVITEASPVAAEHRETFTRRHHFQALSLGVGAYVFLF